MGWVLEFGIKEKEKRWPHTLLKLYPSSSLILKASLMIHGPYSLTHSFSTSLSDLYTYHFFLCPLQSDEYGNCKACRTHTNKWCNSNLKADLNCTSSLICNVFHFFKILKSWMRTLNTVLIKNVSYKFSSSASAGEIPSSKISIRSFKSSFFRWRSTITELRKSIWFWASSFSSTSLQYVGSERKCYFLFNKEDTQVGNNKLRSFNWPFTNTSQY